MGQWIERQTHQATDGATDQVMDGAMDRAIDAKAFEARIETVFDTNLQFIICIIDFKMMLLTS